MAAQISFRLDEQVLGILNEEESKTFCLNVAGKVLADMNNEEKDKVDPTSEQFGFLYACAGAVLSSAARFRSRDALAGAMEATLRLIDLIFGKGSKAGFYFTVAMSSEAAAAQIGEKE